MSKEVVSGQTIGDKEYAAYLTVYKQALTFLFGKEAGLSAAHLDGEELDGFSLQVFNHVASVGIYESSEAANTKMWETENVLGREVPYHAAFYDAFPLSVVECGLPYIEFQLNMQCTNWEREYQFFNAAEGGYQYLHDLLIDARYQKKIEEAPTVERALAWLQNQMKLPAQVAPILDQAVLPSTRQPRRRPETAALHNITKEQFAEVLLECGVGPETRAGKWAAVVSALRRLDMLSGSHVAVQKWLTEEFGASPTIRRTLSDKGEYHSVFADREEKKVLEKAKELLSKYK